jgi:hypothetical protein
LDLEVVDGDLEREFSLREECAEIIEGCTAELEAGFGGEGHTGENGGDDGCFG